MRIKLSTITIIPIILTTVTDFLMYYFAKIFHHEGPFPDATISNYARHYPEYIPWRIGMIYAAPLLQFVYMSEYYWLKRSCSALNYSGGAMLKWFAWLSQIACVGLLIAASTIDCGKNMP